jgi:hypothetical protein
MLFRTAVASLLCLASVNAAEDFWLDERLPFVDIRLGYGLTPRPSTFDVDVTLLNGATGTYSYEVEGDSANALSYTIIGGRLEPAGLLIGIELVHVFDSLSVQSVSGVPAPADSSSLQYRSIGGNLLLGAGWAVTRNLHFEALGLLGAGAMDMDTGNGNGINQNDGEGWSWTAGVRGGAYLTLGRVVLGAAIEWTKTEIDVEANWANGNTRVTESTSGVGGRIEIGYHIP